jgi:hypothetical protein
MIYSRKAQCLYREVDKAPVPQPVKAGSNLKRYFGAAIL